MTVSDPFLEVAVVFGVAAIFGAIANWLRQPLIIAFISREMKYSEDTGSSLVYSLHNKDDPHREK